MSSIPSRGQLVGIEFRRARDARGELAHVGAVVAVLRRRLPSRAGRERLAEAADLAARVVDVVLALDGMPGEGEDPAQAVAVGGVARRGHGERARRVGADELHEHALGVGPRHARAEVAAGLGDRAQG
jgi:hypothetical protein